MNNPISSILEDFGLNTASKIRLAEELSQMHDGELQSIIQSFSGTTIPTHDNGKVNSLTMRYAVVNAFESGADGINDEDMENALARAVSFAERSGTFSINVDSVDSVEGSENDSEPSKRTRNPKLYPTIERLVQASPDATKEQITEQVLEIFPGTVEGTIVMYYYKARKDQGLKNNGKRGRKASKVYPTVLELVKANPGMDRKELIELAVAEGVNESTANVYVGKALKELES